MAFALAAALARKHAPGEIKEIHLKGSGLMVTGVQAVLIPNSHGRHGGFISTAMGVVAGDPDMDMEVLTKITDENLEKAEALVNRLLAAGAFTQDLAELDHIRYAMKLTQDICQDGIDNPLGMQCGRVLLQNMEKGLVAKDEYNYTLAWTIAGLDARMGGTSYTAMSNTGSGNQGIICDGAKPSCAFRAYTGLFATLHAMLLAEQGIATGSTEGIVHESADVTIDNIYRLQKETMSHTDEFVWKIKQEQKTIC